MSGKTTDEAETAFIHSGPSKGYSHSSIGLYVQNESVNFPTTSTGRASEDAPLLSTEKNTRRRGHSTNIGIISLLVFASVLAGSVAFVSIVLLAVNPESLQGDVLKIFPNDTILAVQDAGLDPGRVNYALYKYYGVDDRQQNTNKTDKLLLYRQQCNDLKRQSRVVDVDNTYTLPDNVSIVEIDHQYLLKGSSITYHINMTLTSEAVPSHCYAKLSQRDDGETVEICNSTAATLPVMATKSGYALVDLVILDSKAVQLKAVNTKARGTVYYYDIIQSKAQPVCQIDPPTNTSCSIPIRDDPNQGGSSGNVCIFAKRESSHTFEYSEFEYYVASFAYGQVILVTLICVGLLSFVCVCGLSISCCTKQGRRLRVALHMSSPLN